MSVEADIFSALKALTSNRVYPDQAPEGVVTPYVTYQRVGGRAVNFLDGSDPDKENGRWQVSIWAETRLQASTIARLAKKALRAAAPLQATVLGEPVDTHETTTNLYGTRQDFSFWFSP
ncbi:DUF3168 domain-containing protein [Collimonas fungivorans]|uniref:DUF3168 domain-containing protein n=1 Tax=Collimonas fungivorans TaxID=158899 RepID=UPI0005A2ABE3|nr:DUF3168 domain-containing protein [Collimonas fungivorans]